MTLHTFQPSRFNAKSFDNIRSLPIRSEVSRFDQSELSRYDAKFPDFDKFLSSISLFEFELSVSFGKFCNVVKKINLKLNLSRICTSLIYNIKQNGQFYHGNM